MDFFIQDCPHTFVNRAMSYSLDHSRSNGFQLINVLCVLSWTIFISIYFLCSVFYCASWWDWLGYHAAQEIQNIMYSQMSRQCDFCRPNIFITSTYAVQYCTLAFAVSLSSVLSLEVFYTNSLEHKSFQCIILDADFSTNPSYLKGAAT